MPQGKVEKTAEDAAGGLRRANWEGKEASKMKPILALVQSHHTTGLMCSLRPRPVRAWRLQLSRSQRYWRHPRS
jgi:hypothetical protein